MNTANINQNELEMRPHIIGIGPGNPGYLYPLAAQLIAEADVIIGGRRNLDEFAPADKQQLVIDKGLASLLDFIAENWQSKRIVVLASGDTGLFSIRAYLQNKLPDVPFRVLPGISSLQYLIALRNVNLNDLKIITLHGSDNANLLNTVARNAVTAIFCGGKNSPQAIAARLTALDRANLTLTVGENLSYPNERVLTGTPSEIAALEFEDLSIMLVENPDVSNMPWQYLTGGLPDELFIRDEVPMTKSEIRAIITSKLRLKADSRLLEIGAGTGSVTIEAALIAHEGKVVALEKNPTAYQLCLKNIAKFGVDNITLIEGSAPQAIPADIDVDRVFIGGSGGNMGDIIALFKDSDKPMRPMRIVISAITVESVAEALTALNESGFENIEIVQAAVARSRKAGSKHLMMGLNPITIISGEKA